MKKFDSYPIYINHPGTWEQVRQRQRDYFVDQGDYKMMSWLDYTGKRLYETMGDQNPKPENVFWENDVYRQLQTIAGTKIGKILLDCLDKNIKYWIIPLDYIDKLDCKCGAYTFPGHPREGGGIRMYYNPHDFAASDKKWIGADDVLFHELVHAYRIGSVGYEVVNGAKYMIDHENAEEFFALQMQNMYLACRGAKRFYKAYKRLEPLSKSAAYQHYADSAEDIMGFKYFVEREPLAKTIAKWLHPPDSYNPWRDHPVLERMYISRTSLGVRQLPPL